MRPYSQHSAVLGCEQSQFMHELITRIHLIILDVPRDLAIDELNAVLNLSESVSDDSLPFLFDETPELEAVKRHCE